MATKSVSIVIPVYADWLSLSDCLDSLIDTVDFKEHKVILINDSGPEADSLEKKIKAKIENRAGFEYYRNPKNLGFLGTCNRAVFELDKSDNDILLLNSDTKVTRGWLEEMRSVLYASSKHAAVSPRSNNASIATIPLSQAINHGIDAHDSYEIYKKIKDKLQHYYIAATALGFCMIIRRSLIKEYGLFDEAFGKGYGEEVDFCRRVKKRGYLSVITNHAYVFHLEARSFTNERKKKLIEAHNQVIWERYPEYRQENRDWMDDKVPLETAIEKTAGINAGPKAGGIRGMLKPYPRAYKTARTVYRRMTDRKNT